MKQLNDYIDSDDMIQHIISRRADYSIYRDYYKNHILTLYQGYKTASPGDYQLPYGFMDQLEIQLDKTIGTYA